MVGMDRYFVTAATALDLAERARKMFGRAVQFVYVTNALRESGQNRGVCHLADVRVCESEIVFVVTTENGDFELAFTLHAPVDGSDPGEFPGLPSVHVVFNDNHLRIRSTVLADTGRPQWEDHYFVRRGAAPA
jgi:hypothetical protein